VAFTADEVAKLIGRPVRIVVALSRADPAFVVPAIERGVFAAGKFVFELFQIATGFVDRFPHTRRIGRAQRFFQLKRRPGLPLCDLNAEAGVDRQEAFLRKRHSCLRLLLGGERIV
jgi:hypothetical protein